MHLDSIDMTRLNKQHCTAQFVDILTLGNPDYRVRYSNAPQVNVNE